MEHVRRCKRIQQPVRLQRLYGPTNSNLKSVGFFTEADGASYTVSVYDAYSGGTLSNLLASTTGTETYAGYHTIDLPTAVSLAAGSDFYVCLNITGGGAYPLASDYAVAGYDSACTASPGQSYYSFNGSHWTDLTTVDPTANFCINALTENVALPTTTVALDAPGGNLLITDVAAGGKSDHITLSMSRSNVIVSDPGNILGAGLGATQVDPHTVSVPLASIGGNIQVNTLGGDDTLTVDDSGGTIAPLISYVAGSGDNSLVLQGGTYATVTHSFTNAHDGSVSLNGTVAVTYTGLSPITDNLNAATRVFDFTGGAPETITLLDDGVGGNNMSEVTSSLAESVTFTDPTVSLTLNANAGLGPNTVFLQAVDTSFNASVILNASNQGDTINVQNTLATEPLTINGGAGDDIINIGSAGNSLGTILGAVAVHGNGQTTGDILNLNDQGDGASHTYTITSTTLARSGAATITYDTVEVISVRGSTNADTLNVLTTAAGVTTNFVGGAGSIVNVDNAGTVQGILGALNIENPPSFNSIVIDDSADSTARTVTLSSFSPNPFDSDLNSDTYGKVHLLAPADINYEFGDTSSLTIDGGSGGNTFNVTTTMAGSFGTTTINGGTSNDIFNVSASAPGR